MGADSMSQNKADYLFYTQVLDQIKQAAELRMQRHYSPYLLTAKERVAVQQFEALRDDAYARLQQSGEKL